MRVLCVGAHPDDIEIGCAGFTLKFIQQYKIETPISGFKRRRIESKEQSPRFVSRPPKNRVPKSNKRNPIPKKAVPSPMSPMMRPMIAWLVMTKGDYDYKMAKIRMSEQKAVQAMLPQVVMLQGSMPDNYLHQDIKGMIGIIEGKIEDYEIDTVITHSRYDTHHDHRAVYQASYEAARKIPNLLSYEEGITGHGFRPNMFVDVVNEMEKKIEILNAHKSQNDRISLKLATNVGIAIHRAAQHRQHFGYREAFEIIKCGSDFCIP